MKALATFVAISIRDAVQHGYRSSAGVEFRPVVGGMPASLLEAVFEILSAENGVALGDPERRVPVFLVDSSATDSATMSTSRCSPSRLVAARNQLECFLTLCPPGESIPKSMTTTMTSLGLTNPDAATVTEWLEQPIVRDAIDASIATLSGGDSAARMRSLFDVAAEDANQRDRVNGGDREKWDLLARFMEVRTEVVAMVAVLGFPPTQSTHLGDAEQKSVISRLAQFVEANGFTRGFEMLGERANPDITTYLTSLKQHLIAVCGDASAFATAPTRFYSPLFSDRTLPIPDWWKRLDVDTLVGILDGTSDAEPNDADLVVKPCQLLLPRIKGTPCVFEDNVCLTIELPEGVSQTSVAVSRAIGKRDFEQIDTVVTNDPSTEWHDNSPPEHDRFLRYRFEAIGFRTADLQAIVLSKYSCGIVPYARNAKKTTPYARKEKAKIEGSRKTETRYESDVELTGMGTHQLDLYVRDGFTTANTIYGFGMDADDDDEGAGSSYPVNMSSNAHAVCLIDADEECYYDLVVKHPDGNEFKYRTWIRADDTAPTGACSEFDRLVIENRSHTERVAARVEIVGSRSLDLEAWLLEEVESAYPLVLGEDYRNAWRKPDFKERPILSARGFIRDSRPPRSEFNLPPALASVRLRILQELKSDAGEETPIVERARLGAWMQSADRRELVATYIDEYLQWLNSDYDIAAWMDVIAVCRAQDPHILDTYPHAILLSPIHPIRFVWQCRAQQVLKEAIESHTPCPAASVLDPASVPDCLALPCRTATGGIDYRSFVSLHSTSDYWSVMWSTREVTALEQGLDVSIFNDEFGIRVDGLSAGFSTAQVERSLDEVRRIAAGQATLRVAISSDTTGSSSCNQGIDNWATRSLGATEDSWFAAGAHGLEVFDERAEPLHPEPSALASLTSRTNGAVLWFRDKEIGKREKCDLAVIAHLGCDSPEFASEGLSSPIDPSGLLRTRIRRQVPLEAGTFIAESRVGKRVNASLDSDGLSRDLTNLCVAFESACREKSGFDSYVFAPRIATLDRALQGSRYCAVSSTNIDPACFFTPTSSTYLWDYELPGFSRRVGESAGFYLLAAEQPSMLIALRSSLKQLRTDLDRPDESLRHLLGEISQRGMPTLRRLTSGGAAALGEVGLLVALRLLQLDFARSNEAHGLIPVRPTGNVLNLVIPVDPFQGLIDNLRAGLGLPSRERPDLLAISIAVEAGLPTRLRLTPIEVKTRSSTLSDIDRVAALKQAVGLATTIEEVRKRAAAQELWGIAWRHLLSTWLTYAFRVYGQLPKFMNQAEWATLHAAVIELVCESVEVVEIDSRGRLVIIEDASVSRPSDIDGDGFKECITLSRQDAHAILLEAGPLVQQDIKQKLGNWEIEPVFQSPPAQDASPAAHDVYPTPEPGPQDKLTAQHSQQAGPTPQQPQPITDMPKSDTVHGRDSTEGLRFSVGRSTESFNSRELYFHPSNTALTQLNIGVVGNLGTGKTQLLKGLLFQLTRNSQLNRGLRPRILVFDYKKDYSEEHFVKAIGATVVSPRKLPLNLFDIADCTNQATPWLERARFFTDVLDKIYSNIGAVQRQRLKSAVKLGFERAAQERGGSPTINDVFQIYADACGQNFDTPYSIMSDIVDMELFDSDRTKIVPFSQFFNGVTVISLGDLGQDDQTKNMLVAILLNLFYEHMLKVEKRGFTSGEPSLRAVDSFLLVDEADNIMQFEFDVLRKILLQGREFGVGVILASQYLSHFKTRNEDYREPLLTWFIHQVPNVTVRDLQAIGLTRSDNSMVDEIKRLACHHCLYKSLDVDGEFMRGHPFFELEGPAGD